MNYGQNNGYYMPNYYYPQNGAMPDMLNQAKMQYTQSTMAQPIPMQKITNDTMIWALNESEATSYPVAPNNTVVLWDKNNPTIYVKSVNAQGVPSFRILDFVERTETAENTPKTTNNNLNDKFVTKEQFDDLKADFECLNNKYNLLLDKPTSKTTKNVKKEVENDG